MCECSDLMNKYVFPDKPVEFEGTKGIDLLTPEESKEACKDWVYFKKSQEDLSDQWKQFWAKNLIEDYSKEEEDAILERSTSEKQNYRRWMRYN